MILKIASNLEKIAVKEALKDKRDFSLKNKNIGAKDSFSYLYKKLKNVKKEESKNKRDAIRAKLRLGKVQGDPRAKITDKVLKAERTHTIQAKSAISSQNNKKRKLERKLDKVLRKKLNLVENSI